MFKKTLQATHPDMMRGVDASTLADRYLVTELFTAGEVNLTYAHNERFVIGGASPAKEYSSAPVVVPGLAGIVDVAAGADHT